MLKVINKSGEIVSMRAMEPLQVGVRCIDGHLVMRTASSTLEVMDLSDPGKDKCWKDLHGDQNQVQLLGPGERVTIELYNDLYGRV